MTIFRMTKEIEFNGIRFDVVFNARVGYKGDRINPPEPAQADLVGIYFRGEEFTELLDREILSVVDDVIHEGLEEALFELRCEVQYGDH